MSTTLVQLLYLIHIFVEFINFCFCFLCIITCFFTFDNYITLSRQKKDVFYNISPKFIYCLNAIYFKSLSPDFLTE